MRKPTPILFYGDSPDLHTGLGRIGRDLAVLTSSLPEYRVGYLGRGGVGTSQLPFQQYNFCASCDQWGEEQFVQVWNDFAGVEKGVVFTIWDASRLTWFGAPTEGLRRVRPALYGLLTSNRFEKWGYFPVDAYGYGERLTMSSRFALAGFNRVLGYGAWGARVLEASIGREVDWIPHGLEDKTWTPRDKKACRMMFSLPNSQRLVGCVMSNQTRKDWGLACTIATQMRDCRFWFHIDTLARSERWDLKALISDTGIQDRVTVTYGDAMTDEEMSYHYSACDLTMLPSLGEGFGYPIVESQACGVPCVHGNYAGGAELVMREEFLVEPTAWRMEGLHGNVRPVYRPEDWVTAMYEALDSKVGVEECVESVEHLRWRNLWPGAWKKFFAER